MSTFRKFEEIEAWQEARALTRQVYSVSGQGTFSKDFVLRDQVRRATVSIMSNIAEGFERDGTGEFVQFLSVAKGSAGELRAQLYVALDQNYVNEETFQELSRLSEKVAAMIGGLMKYLKESGIKGKKFKKSASPPNGQSG